jgi:hypothetical protein
VTIKIQCNGCGTQDNPAVAIIQVAPFDEAGNPTTIMHFCDECLDIALEAAQSSAKPITKK